MSYHGDDIDPSFRDRLRALFVDPAVRHAILSNCGEERFLVLGRIFPEIPILRGYRRADGEMVLRIRRGEEDSLGADALAALLGEGARSIRKPDGGLVREAMTVLGVEKPHRVVMIGDQYMTDVASASLAGARSIKVETWRRDTFPLPVKLSQAVEKLLFLLVHGRSGSVQSNEPKR
ncbi:MAG: HAD hydrolase-like protein [Candidatus Eisenbacteria bacterium]|uniref:HAD hydrolase-like protein n=1 Tax=Eiseniibacteriota bacterium TaxID=2212470 RepID=A0A956LVH9_UNCEI|nr:HAD hydrolase-like protein [Candidatus Eisenbacteria bacterium]